MSVLVPQAGAMFGGQAVPAAPPSAPTPTVIQTQLGTIFARAPAVTVYRSNSLTSGWTEVPHCYCDELKIAAGPEIDRAILTYHYGTQKHQDSNTFAVTDKLSLSKDYFKITIEDWWNTPPGDAPITWYGVYEEQRCDVLGAADGVSTGTQTITVMGLARLLERKQIETAKIANSDESAIVTVQKGLTFNLDDRGKFTTRGNRSTSDTIGSSTTYIFSYQERGEEEWNAKEAVRYLFQHQAPEPPGVTWALNLQSGSLDWNPRSVRTDRRTVKEVLDELISRYRGVGYKVEFDGVDTINVFVFSFSDLDIAMPNGTTFEANPSQYSLDFEEALDLSSCVLHTTRSTQFHRIAIEGDYRTSTCSLRVAQPTDGLASDWSNGEQTDFLAAASTETWYGALTDKEKRRANKVARTNDRWKHVFSRFRVDYDWDKKTASPNNTATRRMALPVIDVYNANPIVDVLASAIQCNIPRLVMLDHLPLREQYDYSADHIPDNDFTTTATPSSEPPFRQPFAFFKSDQPRDPTWERLDKFDGDVGDQPDKRKWSVSVKAHDDRSAISLNVMGGDQQMLAKTIWTTGNPAPSDHTEIADVRNHAIDYDDCWVTCTIELPERARIERVLELVSGEVERVLRVHVPDCRLDYVVPNTCVGIESGVIKLSNGGFVRDDTPKLAAIARAAEIWYGKQRQTLNLTFKQVREFVQVGWLITDIADSYKVTGINSVVNAIVYDLKNQTTTFETQYADFDLG